jgi:hypothetical protein
MGLALLLPPTLDAPPRHEEHHAEHAHAPVGLVARVRDVTRPFLDVNAAMPDYVPFLGCVSGTEAGAMGVHFVKESAVFDGKIDPDEPEALMYEMREGRLFLLGAEYIVMADAWDANNAAPPVLMGQAFTFNDSPNRFGLPAFYALHVWAWRENPNGAFVDWHPNVSCESFTQNP